MLVTNLCFSTQFLLTILLLGSTVIFQVALLPDILSIKLQDKHSNGV